jgi:plastocyanin
MPRRRLRSIVLLLALLAASALAAAPPAAAGGGCHRPATEGRGGTLTLNELCFSPTVLRVAPGSEVTVVNKDTVAHPLGRAGGDWYWDGAVGDRATVRFETSGIQPFFCYQHPGMVAVVVVGDGRGAGASTVEVATQAARAAQDAGGGAAPAATQARASIPAAWLLVVAAAALLGALGGTRLAAWSRRSRG